METGSDRIRNIVLGKRNFSRLDEVFGKRVDIHEGLENRSGDCYRQKLRETPASPLLCQSTKSSVYAYSHQRDLPVQAFDLFFTTKPVGFGTGLGLSISYQIITEQHGGQLLHCISQPGQGTEFIIDIPIQRDMVRSLIE